MINVLLWHGQTTQVLKIGSQESNQVLAAFLGIICEHTSAHEGISHQLMCCERTYSHLYVSANQAAVEPSTLACIRENPRLVTSLSKLGLAGVPLQLMSDDDVDQSDDDDEEEDGGPDGDDSGSPSSSAVDSDDSNESGEGAVLCPQL